MSTLTAASSIIASASVPAAVAHQGTPLLAAAPKKKAARPRLSFEEDDGDEMSHFSLRDATAARFAVATAAQAKRSLPQSGAMRKQPRTQPSATAAATEESTASQPGRGELASAPARLSASELPPPPRIAWAVAESQGKRQYMEDRSHVVGDLGVLDTRLGGSAYLAVLDGHGGCRCVDFSKRVLHQRLSRALLSELYSSASPVHGTNHEGGDKGHSHLDEAVAEAEQVAYALWTLDPDLPPWTTGALHLPFLTTHPRPSGSRHPRPHLALTYTLAEQVADTEPESDDDNREAPPSSTASSQVKSSQVTASSTASSAVCPALEPPLLALQMSSRGEGGGEGGGDGGRGGGGVGGGDGAGGASHSVVGAVTDGTESGGGGGGDGGGQSGTLDGFAHEGVARSTDATGHSQADGSARVNARAGAGADAIGVDHQHASFDGGVCSGGVAADAGPACTGARPGDDGARLADEDAAKYLPGATDASTEAGPEAGPEPRPEPRPGQAEDSQPQPQSAPSLAEASPQVVSRAFTRAFHSVDADFLEAATKERLTDGTTVRQPVSRPVGKP